MKTIRKMISVLLSAVLLLSVCSTAAMTASAAYQVYDVNVIGTYGQTEARDMLQLINAFRTGTVYEEGYTEENELMYPGKYKDSAWYLNPDGSKNTSKIGHLSELQYDYGLEKIAMQRAAEVAVYFQHQRPNGDELVSKDPKERITDDVSVSGPIFNKYAEVAENIASGQKTKEEAMKFWREKDEDYVNQGHRRSMLSCDGDYKYVGIAHFIMNGVDYWVQEFSVQPFSLQKTQVCEENRNVPIQIRSDYIEGSAYPDENQTVHPYVGDSVILPKTLPASIFYHLQSSEDAIINIEFALNWNVPTNEYVRYEDGKLVALKEGNYTVTGTTASGRSLNLHLVITEGCNHNYVEKGRVEPTCTKQGGVNYTCTICGESKVDILPKLPHTFEEISRTEPTCKQDGKVTKKCTVCGTIEEETLKKLSHELGEPFVEKEATCTENGLAIYTCSLCGDEFEVTIPKLTHEYRTREHAETCTENGWIRYTCTKCGDTYEEILVKHPHTWEEYKRTAATETECGKIYYRCSECNEAERIVDDPSQPKLQKNGWYQEANGKWRYYTSDIYVRYWQTIDGKRYFFDNDGYRLENAPYIIENVNYYFDENGVMHTGWLTMNGNKFYFGADGAMKTGWQKLSGQWYFFNSSGAMVKGWQKLSGKWYLFAYGDGHMLTGWVKSGSKWYFFNGSGVMLTGWQKLSGKWYFFNGSGAMLTGWQKLSGKWYYFNSSGAMVSGWQKIGGKWYYFNGGVMVTGTKKIGSKTYRFNASGVCLNP